ncbi:MAG: murein biosynthesis integral membrane protein MurJ [Candidatus Metalachnospira sp.]|nr:murein biosynthesis integral membrane protein MurJ [Candidatus Metalachnospira sp.]
MSDKNQNAVKAATSMMIITLIGKILGLVRDTLLAANYGIGMEANAFQTASRIPRVFFDVIFASAISASFIPIFNENLEKKGEKSAFGFSNKFITIILIVTVILTAAGMAFAHQLTALFSPGFNNETMALSAKLLYIMFPTVIFTGVAYSFVGILQSFDEFTIPAALSIVSNGIIIIYYLFFNQSMGIYGLAFAFLIGWAMQAVMQIPSLIKKGYKYKPSIKFKEDDSIKKVLILMVPVMVSTWVQPINITINSRFASNIYGGAGTSVIEYANNLYTIIVGVFVLSVTNVIFPRLSRMTANNDKDAAFDTVIMTIRILSFIIIPMTAGVMALSGPIITLIYQRGDFTAYSTSLTSGALFYFSLGMFGYALQTVISRAFFAEQNGKAPLIGGIASIIVNILLCMLLFERMSVSGLALASAISSTVYGIGLYIPLRRKHKDADTKGLGLSIVKMVICALVMTAAVVPVRNLLWNPEAGLIMKITSVGISVITGIVVYIIMSKLTKLYEAELAFDFAKKILKKNRQETED